MLLLLAAISHNCAWQKLDYEEEKTRFQNNNEREYMHTPTVMCIHSLKAVAIKCAIAFLLPFQMVEHALHSLRNSFLYIVFNF